MPAAAVNAEVIPFLPRFARRADPRHRRAIFLSCPPTCAFPVGPRDPVPAVGIAHRRYSRLRLGSTLLSWTQGGRCTCSASASRTPCEAHAGRSGLATGTAQ